MWSALKVSSRAQLSHDKRVIPTFDTVLSHSNLSSLRRKYLSDVPKDKIVMSFGPKISKRRHWQLKNKERKCHFRFVERRLFHRKRGTSARASLSPHHSLAQERTARFTARPFSALIIPFALVGYEIGYSRLGPTGLVGYLPSHIQCALMEQLLISVY